MARDIDTLAHRIAQMVDKQPDRDALAFDADGKLIDWREIGSQTWANGSHDGERVFVVAGDADAEAIRRHLDETG